MVLETLARVNLPKLFSCSIKNKETNQDASSIMNRVEEILKIAILYSAFLFASILFDFQVTLTVFLIVGGTLISWLTIDETLKEILNTFAFLFFVHPFDIGDKIVLSG